MAFSLLCSNLDASQCIVEVMEELEGGRELNLSIVLSLHRTIFNIFAIYLSHFHFYIFYIFF